jgi:alkylation response protein AidB-like acyl-CoA dehydrogenase
MRGTHKQFGKAIGSFEGEQFMLADMAIKTQAARSVTYDAVDAAIAGDADASRLIFDRQDLRGGRGDGSDYRRGPGARRIRLRSRLPGRDADEGRQIQQICEGTDQIQRALIARDLLGDAARSA